MDAHFYIIFTRSIMGNNGGLLLCIIITHYYIRMMSYVHVIMSSFLHIITYYYMLLHIIAFANTLLDLVLTGPRASTPDVLDTPDDDVPEPYPQSPPETDMHERQKSQAAVT